MTLADDGGRAFPHAMDARARGMTLRDYYAGQAAVAVVASLPQGIQNGLVDYPLDKVARFAFDFADAMIKARG